MSPETMIDPYRHLFQFAAQILIPLALIGAGIFYNRRCKFLMLGSLCLEQKDETGMQHAARQLWMSRQLMWGCLFLAGSAAMNLLIMGQLPS